MQVTIDLKTIINKLQAAFDRIQKLEEELIQYKEAARSEAELDELTSILDLKKETIVEMQRAYETLQAHNEMLIATVDNLKEENKKLVECVKFYANQKSWYGFAEDRDIVEFSDCEPVESIIRDDGVMLGGKRARQVLKEIGEE